MGFAQDVGPWERLSSGARQKFTLIVHDKPAGRYRSLPLAKQAGDRLRTSYYVMEDGKRSPVAEVVVR